MVVVVVIVVIVEVVVLRRLTAQKNLNVVQALLLVE